MYGTLAASRRNLTIRHCWQEGFVHTMTSLMPVADLR